jgi:hypothetical protein
MPNKGKNKTRMRPGRKRVKSAGFKKKKVISLRKKVRNKWGASCRLHDDDGFVPSHVLSRHEGRSIRKENRLASNTPTLKAV